MTVIWAVLKICGFRRLAIDRRILCSNQCVAFFFLFCIYFFIISFTIRRAKYNIVHCSTLVFHHDNQISNDFMACAPYVISLSFIEQPTKLRVAEYKKAKKCRSQSLEGKNAIVLCIPFIYVLFMFIYFYFCMYLILKVPSIILWIE